MCNSPHALRRTLANGTELAAVPLPHSLTTGIHVASRTGSGSECIDLSGITHFVEHMLFRETGKAPGAIPTAIERLGGEINAATELEITTLASRVPTSQWHTALTFIGQMIREPLMYPQEIEKERTVILDELALIEDIPEESVHRAIGASLWPDHPFGREIAGTVESVRSLTQEALRSHARQMFSGRNTVATVAGAIDPVEALDALSTTFDALPEGTTQKYAEFQPKASPPPTPQVIPKSTEQTYFSVAGFTPGRATAERYPMEVIGTILGSGFGSRLLIELRERRGLTYDLSTDIGYGGAHAVLAINGATDPEDIAKTVSIVLVQLNDIKTRGVSTEELNRARAYITGALLRVMEDAAALSAWHTRELVLETDPLSPARVIARLQSITIDELFSTAAGSLDAAWPTIVIAGPVDRTVGIKSELEDLFAST